MDNELAPIHDHKGGGLGWIHRLYPFHLLFMVKSKPRGSSQHARGAAGRDLAK
jgi:hypothetical protein